MKNLHEVLQKIYIPPENKGVLCHWIQLPNYELQKCDPPILSTDHACQFCGKSEHASPFKSDQRVWLCLNTFCDVYKLTKWDEQYVPTDSTKRFMEWPLFCENNQIGDLHHSLQFEHIQQSSGKIEYMRKFAENPCGMIFMEGPKGTGKTFSAMAICELYTRKKGAARFMTQQQMLKKWMDAVPSDGFIYSIEITEILVIDDFGIAELTTGFLKFFMDLINTRLQWSNRGTVITTNLDNEKISLYCGEALSDRLMTGQKFVFTGESRRKKTIL